ncbi:MAG: signal peptidase II [Lachnospiraceae bacterium]|nr:signal peptidase II [Lachnospiraceae bacterium]
MNDSKYGRLLRMFMALAVFILLVAVDQFTKRLIMLNIPLTGDISVIDGVFKIVFVKNTGAAWGIFKDSTLALSVFSCLVLAAVVFFFFRLRWSIKKHRPLMIICILISAGAVGNLIDRLYLHYVVDFLYFELINFPVFNIADCYITLPMIVLAFMFLFYYKEEDFDGIWRSKKGDPDNG